MNRYEMIRRTLLWEQVAAAARAKAAELREELTEAARAELAEQGTAPTWRLPDLATVTLPISKESVYVSDQDAVTKWVAERHPDEIEEIVQVRPGFLMLLTGSEHDGENVFDRHGEVIPGLSVRPGGQPGSLAFRPSREAKAVLAAAATETVDALTEAVEGTT